MKKIFTLSALFCATLLVFPSSAIAQRSKHHNSPRKFSIVYIEQDDQTAQDEIIEFYLKHRHRDYQGVATQAPHFAITDPSSKAIFTVGGFVNMRTAYDFTNVMPNLDFIPAVIPMSTTVSNSQRVLMDASTSRVFMESVIKTGCGTPLHAYVEGDFRGVSNAFHLRQAYVSFGGWKAGKAVSTFTDINSAFNTIDFEGPNAFSYRRNLMIQYTKNWWNGLGLGVAIEFPEVSSAYNSYTQSVYQRVPDIPMYLQYQWGQSNNPSHIRLTGVVRNMFYTNNVVEVNEDNIGWGAQLSGALAFGHWGKLYGQALYGEGIGEYIQDLMGIGYDLVGDNYNHGHLLNIPAMAWFVGMQFNLCEQKMPLTLGYSQVSVYNRDNYMSMGDYKLGQYVVANCFYNFSRALSVGVEYLYGTRNEYGGGFGHSQRVQTAIQFNF